MHSAWKRHQDAVFCVDINLAIKEAAHYFSKVDRLKTAEMLYEKRYLSPRPRPKISLKHDHNWT